MKFCRSDGHQHSARRNAFTLIEVVVGLALMASVLVASLLAFSAHSRQRALASAKRQAVITADQLLQQLSVRRGGIPPTGRGLVAGRVDWFWRTDLVGTTAPAGIPMRVIRFQIVRQNGDGSSTSLASVEVVDPV